MKLSELFFQLSVGELSNLSIGMEGAGTIKEGKQAQVLMHVNSGLLDIYSRFELMTKDVLIEQSGNRTLYPLESKYAEMNTSSTETEKFIKDGLHDKFIDDVIQINSVQDFTGYQYPMNDSENVYSLFTPQPHILQVPFPKIGVAISVGYRARHPLLTWTTAEVSNEQVLELPFFLQDALRKYVASQIFSNMVGQEHMLKAQECYAAYEQICSNIEDKDLASQTISTTNIVFEKRGFI